MNKTSTMRNAYWVAIQTRRKVGELEQLFQQVGLTQKGVSDFWSSFNKVRDYI